MAPTSQSPLVSVVIPHRGEDKPLEKCLTALRSQTYPRQDTEILIVLNEESKRSVSFPLEPGEKLLWEPQSFSYAARNQGILHARGHIIALTDSDTVPSTEWLSEGVAAMEGMEIWSLGALTSPSRDSPLPLQPVTRSFFPLTRKKM